MADRQNGVLQIEVGKVFTPASPVNIGDLFAGRLEQLRRIIGAINQQGQHAIVFGERGVGKTSLANIMSMLYLRPNESFFAPRVNCDSADGFADLWAKVFTVMDDNVAVLRRQTKKKKEMPSLDDLIAEISHARTLAGEGVSPGEITSALVRISRFAGLVIIIDEFDQLLSEETRHGIANTIKALSDRIADVTIIVIGVADSVDELIAGHASIERNLVQILMPRMAKGELEELLDKGMARLEMTISSNARNKIADLSRGLPHYTHLLGLHACISAISQDKKQVSIWDVRTAISVSLNDVQQSIRNAYHTATFSGQPHTIYGQVLAACALAPSNELGWFSASSVKEPLSKIMGKPYEIPGFARHLGAFCEGERGPVLQKEGEKRTFRYRFRNPLMQPLAILKGIAAGYVLDDMTEGD